MKNNWLDKSRQLVTSTMVGGSLALASGNYTRAQQIVPDGTLRTENSVVDTVNNFSTITGGATRGGNLFHSFNKFSVPTGGTAFFNNAMNIQNIISRVTGGSFSSIDGIIAANSTANLFLINPNGIVFGSNAQLSIGGSFMASTANSLNFADGTKFIASDSQPSPLLTVSIPIGLQIGGNGGQIQVRGQGQDLGFYGTNVGFDNSLGGLRVQPGKNLALVGSNVSLDGGILQAPGGRIEVGGLSQTGLVNLGNADGISNFIDGGSLIFPSGVARADVFLSNGSGINVIANGGGSIAINGRELNVSAATSQPDVVRPSLVTAGIASNEGAVGRQVGDITFNATGAITIKLSRIENNVNPGATGSSGNLVVKGGSLSVIGGSVLDTSTLGTGNGGNVSIDVGSGSVNVIGVDYEQIPGIIGSRVRRSGVGRAGNITITAGSLFITDGNVLDASSSGQGIAGNITIDASGDVTLAGASPNQSEFSRIRTTLEENAVGKAGDINITARSLFMDDAFISSRTYGQGDAGNLFITTRGGQVSLINDSQIFSSTYGQGNAGNITINARSVSLRDGSEVISQTRGGGNAGSIQVTATDLVEISGVAPFPNLASGRAGGFSSGFLSTTEQNDFAPTSARGTGNNISLATDTLRISNGGVLSTRTQSNAESGNITVNANALELTGGGQILTSAFNSGNAGNIQLNIRDSIAISGTDPTFEQRRSSLINAFSNGLIDPDTGMLTDPLLNTGEKVVNFSINPISANSGVFANTVPNPVFNATGRTGSIKIAPRGLTAGGGQLQLTVENNGQINVSNQGSGTAGAGNLNIAARSIFLNRQGQFTAEAGSGSGGNIALTVDDRIVLRNQSNITASSGGSGGNVTINAPSGFIIAIPSENSNITANAVTGTGGNVEINSQGVFGIESQTKLTEKSDITASSEQGVSGAININVSDKSSIQNSFTEFSPNVIDTNALIANSCISRATKRQENSFTITGSGALRYSPGNGFVSLYTTGDVRSVEPTSRPWKKGDPIIEPQGVYRLPNGQLILSRSC